MLTRALGESEFAFAEYKLRPCMQQKNASTLKNLFLLLVTVLEHWSQWNGLRPVPRQTQGLLAAQPLTEARTRGLPPGRPLPGSRRSSERMLRFALCSSTLLFSHSYPVQESFA
jgi:hypothetical protein